MGYSSEMPVERGYRDSRINRIFEGTNEINRILVVDTLLKRGARKDFDLFGAAEKWTGDLDALLKLENESTGYYERKRFFVENFKKLALILIQVLSQTFQRKLVHEQELINHLSDIIMNLYVAESTMLRVEKLENLKSGDEMALYKDILDVYIFDVGGLVRNHALNIIHSLDEVQDRAILEKVVDHLTRTEPVNTRNARRRLADKLIEENTYKF